MRKIIVLSFISLDGVMQAPGGPDEDTSGGFKYGGWTAPYFHEADEAANEMMSKQMQPADLLLGRKTFEIFSSYWPKHADFWPGIMAVKKYVMSHTINQSDTIVTQWPNSVVMRNVEDIKKLKATDGGDIQVHGSGNLIQTLLKHNLVDELWLKTFPVLLGSGKRLFAEGTMPAAFTLTESKVTPNGVIFANYARSGEVRTGTVGE